MSNKMKHQKRSRKTHVKSGMSWWFNHCAARRQADFIRNLHRIGVQTTE